MKILYVTTISDTMGFFTSHINMLLEQGHSVDMACNVQKPIDNKLLGRGSRVHNINFSRSPFQKKNIIAYRQLKSLIRKEKYDVVHTHTPVASALVRLVCRKMINIKVIYTAHGFHFYKGAPIMNWFIYYPIEKWLSKSTDILITINKEDYERAKNHFKAKEVEYIPGVGLDVNKFRNVVVDRIAKREEISVQEDAFVVLSVGELNKNKNHKVVIKAIAKLKNPNIIYLICGQGPLENEMINLSKKLGLDNQIKLLGFRNDIAEICKASDVFLFPSKREGLGIAAIEAMACGLPIITSNVRGISDYSIDGMTGYVLAPKDIDGFAKAIKRLLIEKVLRVEMGVHNSLVVNKFNIKTVLYEMDRIYNGSLD